jgi:TrmH family RNA methyltransferase
MTESGMISSRQNPRFKAALALRDSRDRHAQRRLLVDGAREIGRALDAGLTVSEAWVAPGRLRSGPAQALLPRLRAAGVEIVETTPELLGRLAYGERDDGIVIVASEPPTGLEQLDLPERPLIAVVEGIEKPGTLGALLRSADGAGVDAVIAADPVSDTWNPNAIRASLGTIFSLPLAVCTSAEALAFLRRRAITIVTARVDAAADYDAVDLSGPVAIVIGAEVSGLGAAWSGEGVTAVRIPMLGLADSLNVSASAAVLFYEARRQRRAADHMLTGRRRPKGAE